MAAETRDGGTSRLRLPLVVNLGTTVWAVVVGLVAVPYYVHALGMEAYGIVGLFLTLQASLAILDLGLSATMTREIARMRATDADSRQVGEVVRTLEVVYFGVAVLIGIALWVAADWLAYHWVTPDQLDRPTLVRAFRHMALAVAVQWPASIYTGALLGFERQMTYSVLTGVFGTARALTLVAALAYVGATLDVFLIAQTLNSAAQVAVLAYFVWRELPGTLVQARPRLSVLRALWRFAVGNMAINASGLVLSQIDRVVLSRVLQLDQFGLYSLLSTIAVNVSRVVGPVFLLYYPRLAALAASEDDSALRRVYRDGGQVLALLVAPLCVMLMVFARETLVVWTGDATIATQGAAILAVLVAGKMINGLLHLPAALQLAHGWTRLSFYTNLVAIVFVVPSVILGVMAIGPMGAALGWLGMNMAVALVQVPLMHRRLLPGEGLRWTRDAVLYPIAGALVPALVLRAISADASRWWLLLEVTVFGIVSFGVCALTTRVSRDWLRGRLIHA